ncbi:TlpA family protein disulfide reductase [Sphingobacterium detergens]|uniref:Thiol-disulfide isomerase/thioredoxin n=1 Tax=Sphingobacterium detergens TaxID=1145106 RepID=A0A420B699_SPHD1|nr:TlpA disulfide reductase family protein [Sphingobacterium detergens]RKE52300.1 thiol-disulfide isomerase/thioredoxin [Sphingobacterium detergens]
MQTLKVLAVKESFNNKCHISPQKIVTVKSTVSKNTILLNKSTTLLSLTILFQMFSLSFAQSVETRTDSGVMPKITRENVPYFVEIKDDSRKNESVLFYDPKANIKKYPLYEYKANVDRIAPIKLNKTVPDEIWDLPVRIVNDIHKRDSITLRELAKDKILVLDFWARWCSPCLESMHKWQELQPKYADQVQVVGLMMDYEYKAEMIIAQKAWTMPQLVGPEVYLINACFLDSPVLGPSAWIRDGKFIGTTETRANKEELLEELIVNNIPTIPEKFRWKMNDKKVKGN